LFIKKLHGKFGFIARFWLWVFLFLNVQAEINARNTNDSVQSVFILRQCDSFLRGGNFAQSLLTAEKAYAISQSINCKRCAAEALHAIGNAYYYLADYKVAIGFFNKGIALSRALGYKKGLVYGSTDLGLVYFDLGDYANALDYCTEGNNYAQEINDPSCMGMTLNNLGMVYEYQGNFALANECYLKSLNLRLKLNDKPGLGYCYNNIGSIQFRNGNYTQSLAYHLKALSLRREIRDEYVISTSLNNVGLVYEKLGNVKAAEENLLKSLRISEVNGNKYMLGETERLLAEFYYRKGNLGKASNLGYASLKSAVEIKALDLQKSAHQILWKIAEKQGDIKLAFGHLKSYERLSDSVFSEKQVARTLRIQSRVEKAGNSDRIRVEQIKKEIAINSKVRQSRWIWFGFICILILMILLLVITGRINVNILKQKAVSEHALFGLLPAPRRKKLPKAYAHVFLYTSINLAAINAHEPDKDEAYIEFFTNTFDQYAEKFGMVKVYTISEEFVFYSSSTQTVENAVYSMTNMCLAILETFNSNKDISQYSNLFPKIGIQAGEIFDNIVGTRYAEYENWCQPVEEAAAISMKLAPGKLAVSLRVWKLLKIGYRSMFSGNYNVSDNNYDSYFIIEKNEN